MSSTSKTDFFDILAKLTKSTKESKIDNDKTLNRTDSNQSENRRTSRLSKRDSRIAVRQSYFKRQGFPDGLTRPYWTIWSV